MAPSPLSGQAANAHERVGGTVITRRNWIRAATACIPALGCGVATYTWRWEPQWLEIVRRRLPVADLPDSLQGARLAQLSDLHIGPAVDRP